MNTNEKNETIRVLNDDELSGVAGGNMSDLERRFEQLKGQPGPSMPGAASAMGAMKELERIHQMHLELANKINALQQSGKYTGQYEDQIAQYIRQSEELQLQLKSFLGTDSMPSPGNPRDILDNIKR